MQIDKNIPAPKKGEQAHAELEDALDAIGALAWSGERGRDRS